MIIPYIAIAITLITVIFLAFTLNRLKQLKQEEAYLNNKNDKLRQEEINLNDKNNKLKQEETDLSSQNNKLKIENELLTQNIQKYKDTYDNYKVILDQQFQEAESEYDKKLQQLKQDSDIQIQIIQDDVNKERAELLKIQNTRKAAIEAQVREQKIKEQLSFYCLKLTSAELQDIAKLNNLKPSLNNPRILSMLIWQNYYQKPMTDLCNNVIGKNVVCGIYKITNQLNNMCYVGQSVDIAKRFKDHAKCGLGIDTPQNNKLYKAMIQDGLHNFSFELLESCKREELDEKEKSYIKIYQSQSFGYNTVSGNGAIDLLGE